jgi:hypothetical protein
VVATFTRFGPLLDEYLKKFYDDEYFRPDDEYAVAVPVNGGSELLELINAILGSQHARDFLAGAQDRAKSEPSRASE